MPISRIVLPLAALLALAGCNKSAGTGDGTTNQVVEGTTSDAMIAADTLTSEPPTAEPTDEPEAGADGKAPGTKPDAPAPAPARNADTAAASTGAPAAAASPAAATAE